MSDIKKEFSTNLRPKLHFTTNKNWINDPNGFSYFNGSYHLFYQYNPQGITWGNMSWGHAVSDDLINWKELEVAMIPDKPYDKDGVFSGSAITWKDLHYLYYTGVIKKPEGLKQVQCIATSNNGINYIKSSMNPIVCADENGDEYDFRDPKMWIYNNQIYMIVATKRNNNGKAIVYKSQDGYNFEYLDEFTKENTGFMWECPDLFQLKDKWVLIFSAMEVEGYPAENISFISSVDFDYGNSKTKVHDYELIDYGSDYYAPQTMIDNKGRRIVIAWLRMTKPVNRNSTWVGMMTLPREILYNSKEGFSYRIIEEAFINKKNMLDNSLSSANKNRYQLNDNKAYELNVGFLANTTIQLTKGHKGGLSVSYNPSTNQVEVTRTKLNSISKSQDNQDGQNNQDNQYNQKTDSYKTDTFYSPKITSDYITLQVIIDQSVAEIFINDGKYVISAVFSNQNEKNILEIENFEQLEFFELYELEG